MVQSNYNRKWLDIREEMIKGSKGKMIGRCYYSKEQ
jgi:hypothetical protein